MSFPPSTWLGSSLNMLAITPIDFKEVQKSVLSLANLLTLSETTTTVKVGDADWAVPDNVAIGSQDVSSGESSHNTWASGQDALSTMEADVSISGKYMAFKLEGGASYALEKSFTSDYSYDLFNFVQTHAMVKIKNVAKSLDFQEIGNILGDQKPWNPDDKAIRDSYRSIFEDYGSHVIIGADYGARFMMANYASNSEESVKQDFQALIAAEYNGVATEGSFRAELKNSSSMASFERSWCRIVSCTGGKADLALALDSAPQAKNTFEAFTKWVATANTEPAVMSFQVLPLWSMMRFAHDREIRERVEDIQNAFQWLAANPQKHRTECTFTLASDWAEVVVTTPAASIVEVKAPAGLPNDAWSWSSNKIACGKENSYDFKHGVVFNFVIENDGSPVSIEMSHGADGAEPGKGKCATTIGSKTYTNDTNTSDHYWNSQTFVRCEVNRNPVVGA